MSTYCTYYKQKKQVSYDGGYDWVDVSPAEYQKGDLYSQSSTDCDYEDNTNYFTIIALDDMELDIYIRYDYAVNEGYYRYQYKINDGEWLYRDARVMLSSYLHLSSGDIMKIRAHKWNIDSSDKYLYITNASEGRFAVSGDIKTLVTSHFDQMGGIERPNLKKLFEGDRTLVDASNLDVSYIAEKQDGCLEMFLGCSSLTTLPIISASTIGYGALTRMFSGCTSLENIPSNYLTATTLNGYSYWGMFGGCTSLRNTPTLPATTMADSCYREMFSNCTSLTTVSELSATTLADMCYGGMFSGCTSLTTVQNILPATTLTQFCYYDMFKGCTSLTTSPILPAEILNSYCYYSMFSGCSNLQTIKCYATDITATSATEFWVQNVHSTGTFYKNADMNSWSNGINGIPYNWTVVDVTVLHREISGNTYCIDCSKYVDVYSQSSIDNGSTWVTTATTPTIAEEFSFDCGCAKRTISGTPYCSNYNKCVDVQEQITYDSGVTWETTATTSIIVEEHSTDCGYSAVKWIATYNGGTIQSATCDSSSAITSGEITLTGLTSVEIGDCVSTIGESVFYNCSSLTSCTISSGITSISNRAFYSSGISGDLVIPDSVTSIGEWAFGQVGILTNVVIGSGITTIGNFAFGWPQGINSITIKATTPPTLTNSGVFSGTGSCPIYVPSGSVNAYKAATNWGDYTSRIQAIP